MIKKFIILICCLINISFSGGEDIQKRQSELKKLQHEIDLWEKRLEGREKKEKATLELLDSYDQQISALRKLIRNLKENQKNIEKEIEKTQLKISELETQLAFKKNQYTKYVINAYKHGRIHDLELLITSKSLNQVFIRSAYLRKFSEYRQQDIQKIVNKYDELAMQQNILENQLTEQRKLIKSKTQEENRLLARIQERRKVLSQIKHDKQNYVKELERKRKAARDLEKMITRLVEAEEKKIAEGKEISTSNRYEIGSFEVLKGKLPWPVKTGKIVGKFGAYQHPILKTISNNTGIDIAVSPGSDVYSIADGVVATIWWLPSYGNLIIINHFDGYRTVYANLSDIEVNEGDRVTEGMRIGKSDESINGSRIHFELWKGREKQNPEFWLHPQGVAKR